MGLISCESFGVLFVLFNLRLSAAGYCSVAFPCTYTCTYSHRSTYKCGFLFLLRCSRYRKVYATCGQTCYRQECCSGYQGPSCGTPVCFQSTVCPNGGSCVRPDTCSCLVGFTGGPRCEDVNECTTNNGGCQHDCSNTDGSFRCSCRHGYRLGSDGKTCININECATNNGGCQHTCTDIIGSFTCSCHQGYIINTDQKTCTDIDECSVGTAGCDHNCTNTAGSFICSCQQGYMTDETSCVDIDECTTMVGGCSQKCINTVGSFQCSCNTGYILFNDYRTCIRIIDKIE